MVVESNQCLSDVKTTLKHCYPTHPKTKLFLCVSVLLPHIGSASYQSRMTMSELTAKNIIAALEDRPMPAEYVW